MTEAKSKFIQHSAHEAIIVFEVIQVKILRPRVRPSQESILLSIDLQPGRSIVWALVICKVSSLVGLYRSYLQLSTVVFIFIKAASV